MSALSSPPRVALASSRFNSVIVEGLIAGAVAALDEAGVAVAADDRFAVDGAFELPLLAQRLARSGRYDGVICLGCVIKGETAHFEFIGLAASLGLMAVALLVDRPIGFGILTCLTEQQAQERAAADSANKGREAAHACLNAIVVRRHV